VKSRVHPTYKTRYRVGNWPAYDRALVQRGDITLWLAPEAIATWAAVGVGTRGGQLQYSDLAIETALTLRLLFHLPLRQAEGFLTSLFVLMGLDLRSPDHTMSFSRSRPPLAEQQGTPGAWLLAGDWPRRRRLDTLIKPRNKRGLMHSCVATTYYYGDSYSM
jgi:hypothetical protein